MKRNLVALLIAVFLAAACSGMTTSGVPAGDPYRFNPGEKDPAVPIGGV